LIKLYDNFKNNPKNQSKEKKIKCEFLDICKHKYVHENQIKYHCTDINSLTESFCFCIIREKILNILEN